MASFCDQQIRKKLDEIFEKNEFVIASLPGCPPCKKAKELLNSNNIPFHDINIHQNEGFMQCLYEESKSYYAPQIFVKSKYIGGYSDLYTHLHSTGILKQKHI
jgi:glutaredoxin